MKGTNIAGIKGEDSQSGRKTGPESKKRDKESKIESKKNIEVPWKSRTSTER